MDLAQPGSVGTEADYLASVDGSTLSNGDTMSTQILIINVQLLDTYWNGPPSTCEVIPLANIMAADGFWRTHPVQPRLKHDADHIEAKSIGELWIGHGSKRALAAMTVTKQFYTWFEEADAGERKETMQDPQVQSVF